MSLTIECGSDGGLEEGITFPPFTRLFISSPGSTIERKYIHIPFSSTLTIFIIPVEIHLWKRCYSLLDSSGE